MRELNIQKTATTKRTSFEYSWKSHVTNGKVTWKDSREHLPVSGGPRSIFLGPLEIDRSPRRRMMRLDGTRRETGATDYRVEERAHLGRLSLSLSLSSASSTILISCSLSLHRPLFSSSGPHIVDVDLVLPLFGLRRWRWRRAHPFYSAVNTMRVWRHVHARVYNTFRKDALPCSIDHQSRMRFAWNWRKSGE